MRRGIQGQLAAVSGSELRGGASYSTSELG